jgi:hypothetical protein
VKLLKLWASCDGAAPVTLTFNQVFDFILKQNYIFSAILHVRSRHGMIAKALKHRCDQKLKLPRIYASEIIQRRNDTGPKPNNLLSAQVASSDFERLPFLKLP